MALLVGVGVLLYFRGGGSDSLSLLAAGGKTYALRDPESGALLGMKAWRAADRERTEARSRQLGEGRSPALEELLRAEYLELAARFYAIYATGYWSDGHLVVYPPDATAKLAVLAEAVAWRVDLLNSVSDTRAARLSEEAPHPLLQPEWASLELQWGMLGGSTRRPEPWIARAEEAVLRIPERFRKPLSVRVIYLAPFRSLDAGRVNVHLRAGVVFPAAWFEAKAGEDRVCGLGGQLLRGVGHLLAEELFGLQYPDTSAWQAYRRFRGIWDAAAYERQHPQFAEDFMSALMLCRMVQGRRFLADDLVDPFWNFLDARLEERQGDSCVFFGVTVGPYRLHPVSGLEIPYPVADDAPSLSVGYRITGGRSRVGYELRRVGGTGQAGVLSGELQGEGRLVLDLRVAGLVPGSYRLTLSCLDEDAPEGVRRVRFSTQKEFLWLEGTGP